MKASVTRAIERIERHREWNEHPDSAADSPYMIRGGIALYNADLDTIIKAAKKG